MYWQTHELILGLKHLPSHRAMAAKEIVIEGLKPFGIESSDLFLTMSDTATAAIKTGKEILEASYEHEAAAGEDFNNACDPGRCNMHVLNLIVDHASGKKIRTENKVEVDSFLPGADLRRAQLSILTHINSKKQKVF